jgi:predicted nucleic acid-binding protein
MIVADTGGVLALLDRDDRHHARVVDLFRRDPNWILPWAILPEVDYLAGKLLGEPVARAFVNDLKGGLFAVDANADLDLQRAAELLEEYADLHIGLVDAVVMAQAERHQARIIVTMDARHFRAVRLNVDPSPRLVPLDS